MTGQAHPQHVKPFFVENLADAAQAVGGVGQSVKKQGTAPDGFRNEFETPVPIVRKMRRILRAVGAVAAESVPSVSGYLIVNFKAQFFKQPIFLLEVVFQGTLRRGISGCEFSG